MSEAQISQRPHDWRLIAAGTAGCAAGIYFVLVGLGALPPPSRIDGPLWIAGCVGLVLFAPSVTALVRGWLAVPGSQDLPADAPVLLVAAQWLALASAMAGFASMVTWIAFGPGERHFAFSFPLPAPWGEAVGRACFGFSAVSARC